MNAPPGQRRPAGIAQVDQLYGFDAIIDTRSPAEFALDHVPGAINCPALDNEQRAEIGTLYKQVSPFVARRRGAALVAINIGRHLLERFQDKGPDWRPLIYCWRGGKRSGAMTHVLRQIGWHACQLDGGYKSYRRFVVAELAELPRRFAYRVVTGATGSGKSRLLEALAAQGAQVLDLENLAAHKGSVLGELPDAPQPSQKMFESRLLAALRRLDAERPVYVEAESRKIGVLQVPEALLETMRAGPCLCIEATNEARVSFLIGDYDYFLSDPGRLKEKLEFLQGLQSAETLARWQALVDARNWPVLVGELLEKHYDPLYKRSQGRNYAHFPHAPRYATDDLSPAGLEKLARQVLATSA